MGLHKTESEEYMYDMKKLDSGTYSSLIIYKVSRGLSLALMEFILSLVFSSGKLDLKIRLEQQFLRRPLRRLCSFATSARNLSRNGGCLARDRPQHNGVIPKQDGGESK